MQIAIYRTFLEALKVFMRVSADPTMLSPFGPGIERSEGNFPGECSADNRKESICSYSVKVESSGSGI
jgi:hypothetical protein